MQSMQQKRQDRCLAQTSNCFHGLPGDLFKIVRRLGPDCRAMLRFFRIVNVGAGSKCHPSASGNDTFILALLLTYIFQGHDGF
jgi:hypothetical protein